MGIDFLLERIRERQADAANPSLAIDFQVQRLPLAGLQVLDPRLVRIAPGCRNESHRHAHESIFVVLAGEGELRIGAETVPLKAGDVACVPRWLVHQSRNSSSSKELQLLAITDFGLTSGVLGDYDQRTRLKGGGADALVSAEEAVDALTATALNHRAVRHPYLAALADGTLPDPAWALADFARQYQGYAAHFPRYLTALISRLESPAHRQALLENLMEESGQYDTAELETLAGLGIKAEWIKGVPHPQLFERFCSAVAGADRDAAAPEEPEVVGALALGMHKALALRDSFWSWLHERALRRRP
jgi:quercetin dioxygenase-like cupin family protein